GFEDVLSNTYSYLSLVLGNGDGSFKPPTYFRNLHSNGGQIGSADLDADGRLDAIVMNGGYEGDVAVFLNIGPYGDLDRDGVYDGTDACVDTDADGFGDPNFLARQCP